jgi:hypothetical protein
MGAVDSQVCVPLIVNSTNSWPPVRSSRRLPKTHLHTNTWRLAEFEFDSLNALFSINLEACYGPHGSDRHGLLPFYSEKYSFLSHNIAGQYI